MDQSEEIAKFKFLVFALAAFLASTYFSWQEFKFMVWGQTAQATVTNTFKTKSPGRRPTPKLAIEYTFQDSASGPRSERDDVSIDWQLAGNAVTVEYIPGVADSSRLVGNSSRLSVVIFLLCLSWLGYSGFKLFREASEAVHGRKRRR